MLRPPMKARPLIYNSAVALIASASVMLLAPNKASAQAPAKSNVMIEAPADVAAPPADAQKTESGLASKILKEGTGDKSPGATDTVTVHYTGWTTDGKMFDSSVKRGQPASFPLNQVIKGWTEGLQLMVTGEKRRFWIPGNLAYGETPARPGAPAGMLVFDVELLEIQEAPKPVIKDELKVPDDAKKSEGGISYVIQQEGEGAQPGDTDIITFHLTATTMEGETAQDTRQGPTAPMAPLDKLPPTLSDPIKEMKAGEKRRWWLPEPAAPGGFIVADIELISFKEAPAPPPVPEDVAGVPDDAEKTESGLASKVITAGKGGDKPQATSTVKVHYSGWTTDGEMFDSSVTRGEPTEFPLNGVIKGWTEGVQLMEVGEKRRFWIPADMAYGENPGGGRPGGMLVFDIELLEIVR